MNIYLALIGLVFILIVFGLAAAVADAWEWIEANTEDWNESC